MKRIGYSTSIGMWGFVAALLISFSTIAAAEKSKIGVMEFKASQNIDEGIGEFLYDLLIDQFVSSGQYTVVDWEEIDRVLGFIAKSQPNISEEDARRQAVDQLGIQKLYLGSVSKIGSKYYVSVKSLNLDLSVDRSERISVTSEDDLESAVTQLSERLEMDKDAARQMVTTKRKARQARERAEAKRKKEAAEKQAKEKAERLEKQRKFEEGKTKPVKVYKTSRSQSALAICGSSLPGKLKIYTDRMVFESTSTCDDMVIVMPFNRIQSVSIGGVGGWALIVTFGGRTEKFSHSWKQARISKYLPERLARMVQSMEE